MPGARSRLCSLALLLLVSLGCARTGPRTRTIVTGKIEPGQIHFVTDVEPEPDPDAPSGWRVACIRINIQRANTGESFFCEFGVEVPIRSKDGPISLRLAQRITAERTHEAAEAVFSAATPESGLGMLCQTLKTTLKPMLWASIEGSRVKTPCHKKSIPVQFGDFVS
ncbi:hypothetical protein [Archangium lipolyticum]|uniref:hypothetical protein n=1 Tax=Archangium lipolyticum TaxID=2970465 RepID=UPI00214A0903|nr:hypothetical protein [Archangium lipolyticum]